METKRIDFKLKDITRLQQHIQKVCTNGDETPMVDVVAKVLYVIKCWTSFENRVYGADVDAYELIQETLDGLRDGDIRINIQFTRKEIKDLGLEDE